MRLDNYLTVNGYFDSRTKAKQAIERGEILVNGQIITKSSLEILSDVVIERKFKTEYVSLGGFKLEKALSDFSFCVENLVVADIGSSTGGFTDCLLQKGAKKVFSVDLRDDLLHSRLLADNRVSMLVKNAKDLNTNDFKEKLDLIVADLSFISISQVVDVFYNLLNDGSRAIILIKPQFETGKRQKFKNGIIRDKKIQKQVCENVYNLLISKKLFPQAITTAPVYQDKNIEYLILLQKNGELRLKNDFFSKINFE
jgi:23S rRNA (cytidine1920-2'-O)/16S rRNA (cytidine1409-2'-O)-methyltransferase